MVEVVLGTDVAVGICGAGAMGAGIAQVAARAGHAVTVFDANTDALARGRGLIVDDLDRLVAKGRLAAAQAEATLARLAWSSDMTALADCALVIEAIFEDFQVKEELLRALERIVGADAILASNTSSLSITALAAALARPSRLIGLHFFNPAPIMKLVEVVPTADTPPALTEAALALMRAWGKVAVVAKDTPGFIVNLVARPFYTEGWRALEEGAADPATLDFIMRDLAGFRMGPLELGDAIGHDINFAAARSIFEARSGNARFTPSAAQERLVATGRLGRKTGHGVYAHGGSVDAPAPRFLDAETGPDDDALVIASDGRTAGEVAARAGKPVAVLDHVASDQATSLVFAASDARARRAAVRVAARAGKRALEVADRPGLIVLRTLAQLANAAADAARDGVGTPEAIDPAMINGVNYPFGLFAWSERFGFVRLIEVLKTIARETGDPIYEPSELLRVLASRRRG